MIELIISNDSCGFELFSNKIAFASNKLSSCDLIEFSKEYEVSYSDRFWVIDLSTLYRTENL